MGPWFCYLSLLTCLVIMTFVRIVICRYYGLRSKVTFPKCCANHSCLGLSLTRICPVSTSPLSTDRGVFPYSGQIRTATAAPACSDTAPPRSPAPPPKDANMIRPSAPATHPPVTASARDPAAALTVAKLRSASTGSISSTGSMPRRDPVPRAAGSAAGAHEV